MEEVIAATNKIGYPVILRPAFTLGGTGGGFAENEEELLPLATLVTPNIPEAEVLSDMKIESKEDMIKLLLENAEHPAIQNMCTNMYDIIFFEESSQEVYRKFFADLLALIVSPLVRMGQPSAHGMLHVRLIGTPFEVAHMIVELVAVDMVDDLTRCQGSAKHLLCDHSVLVAAVSLPVGLALTLAGSCCSMSFPVSVLILPAGRVPLFVHGLHVAGLAAPDPSLCFVGPAEESCPAAVASALDFRHTPDHLADPGVQAPEPSHLRGC